VPDSFYSEHWRKLDTVYACHAFLGGFHGLITIVLLVDFGSGQALGMLLAIPLFLPAIAAVLTIVVLTIRLRKSRGLVLLLLVLVVPLAAYAPLKEVTGARQDTLLLGYDVAAVMMALRWFFRIRPRTTRSLTA